MLDMQTFKTVIENAPLVSIDLCLVSDRYMLLGKRTNEPLKNRWFTPGGRVRKGETWQSCLKRIAHSELGMVVEDVNYFSLMGIWDHFYPNSAVGADVSTHYVNLPHYVSFNVRPVVRLDSQHESFKWFELSEVANSETMHEYMRGYASWLIKREIGND
jgi:colanic acid biosynthesis protein WcaH